MPLGHVSHLCFPFPYPPAAAPAPALLRDPLPPSPPLQMHAAVHMGGWERGGPVGSLIARKLSTVLIKRPAEMKAALASARAARTKSPRVPDYCT